jgi:hypothetical protein
MRAKPFNIEGRIFMGWESRMLICDSDSKIRADGIAEVCLQVCDELVGRSFSDMPQRSDFVKVDFGQDEVCFVSMN